MANALNKKGAGKDIESKLACCLGDLRVLFAPFIILHKSREHFNFNEEGKEEGWKRGNENDRGVFGDIMMLLGTS